MQKIVLTTETIGQIIDRLRSATSGSYKFYEVENVNPSSCKDWGKPFDLATTKCAKVTVHWSLKDRLSRFNGKPTDLGFPLLHMAIEADCAAVFCTGDVFYFKGNIIIINNAHGSVVESLDCSNIVSKIVCLKREKDLCANEIAEIALQKRQAGVYSRQMWQMTEKDLSNDKLWD